MEILGWVKMVTAEQNVADSHAAPEIPARDLMEASPLQQCSAEAVAGEGEALQQADISAIDTDVQRERVVVEVEASNDDCYV
ncbi:hypothetical protein scyTo_0006637 [Scyliorhinus torazame]|uniref:Uncharacterized protein n=1 Tax=Scyliorhinus torazame TaxID=75743 RepID=A0A401PJ28_SCYTO|nr:hypothetical protein [Scyliorhinus torazame]